MAKASIIYEPGGAAREYAPLALNTYKGCVHACRYCYAPAVVRKTKEQFFAGPDPKENVRERTAKDCRSLVASGRVKDEILLNFIGDPYQPAESELRLTWAALEEITDAGLPVTVLTKGGTAAGRDFGLLAKNGIGRFGTSLVFADQRLATRWEPGAASVKNRIIALLDAKLMGISTWVSLEPVIDPMQALHVIEMIHEAVDFWAIGKINHWPELEKLHDWHRFRNEAEELLNKYGASYFFKKSLQTQGVKSGRDRIETREEEAETACA